MEFFSLQDHEPLPFQLQTPCWDLWISGEEHSRKTSSSFQKHYKLQLTTHGQKLDSPGIAKKSKEFFPATTTSNLQRHPSSPGYRNPEPSSPAPMPSLFKKHLLRSFLTRLFSSLSTCAKPLALLPSALPPPPFTFFEMSTCCLFSLCTLSGSAAESV